MLFRGKKGRKLCVITRVYSVREREQERRREATLINRNIDEWKRRDEWKDTNDTEPSKLEDTVGEQAGSLKGMEESSREKAEKGGER